MSKIALHYQIIGNGPALLLLHGMFGSGNDWEFISQELSKRYTLIIPDLPGFGQSRNFDIDNDWGYQEVIDPVFDLLDSISIKQCTWLGYSLGGRLALYAACRYPEKIKQLVLLGAGPGLDDASEREARSKLDQQRADKILSLGIEQFLSVWYQAELFAGLYANKPLYEKVFQRRILENSADWAAKLMVSLSPGQVPSLWSELSKLQMPTTYVVGELDKKFMGMAAKVKHANSAIDIRIVAEAGHSLHVEQPQSILRALDGIVY